MERILASLKALKANVVTLERTLTHSFKDLISEVLLILFPLKLNKFYLEVLPPREEIFLNTKVTPLPGRGKTQFSPGLTNSLERKDSNDGPTQPNINDNEKLHNIEC